jgi:uncharacterized protein
MPVSELTVSVPASSQYILLISVAAMKFYDRSKELEKLCTIYNQSLISAKMTVLVGRRRIGKTMLMLEATKGQPTLYFFVAKKSEVLLCHDFIAEIKKKLEYPLFGEITSFTEIFQLLMELSKTRSFNLILDEFQEFQHINPSVYSDMQHHWDLNKDHSKMNLFLCGSIFSLMNKIFENAKEPLFGRADNRIHLKPFTVSVLKQILAENNPGYTADDLLAFYTFTGGVAKYIQYFVDNQALTLNRMVDCLTDENSTFINEGRTLLIEEFGRDYHIYFSILAAISQGNNSRSQMENVLHQEIGGGYLTRLEKDYGLITRLRPLFSTSETKNIKYVLIDNFLTFWFRFIYKYSHFIESGSHDELKRVVLRDYSTYSGKMLERYFWDLQRETGKSTMIGGYWDRKGENEIDLIALNEIDKTAIIAEIKCNPANLRMEKLIEKTGALKRNETILQNYQIEYKGLSMNNM